MPGFSFRIFRAASRLMGGRGLRRIPGFAALYRRVYAAVKPSGDVTVDVQGLRLVLDGGDEGVAPALLTHGVFEPVETRTFLSLLQPGMTVLDIGANVGYYSLLAARAVGAAGAVHAFEPEPRNLSYLKRNIKQNSCASVCVVPKALGDCPGRLRLFRDARNFGNPSLAEQNVVDPDGFVEVETVTLDDYWRSEPLSRRAIHLIKMDVQGAEGRVLSGADELLKTHHPILLIEFWPKGLRNMETNPEDLLKTLESAGYRFHVLADHEASPKGFLSSQAVMECFDSLRKPAAFLTLLCQSGDPKTVGRE